MWQISRKGDLLKRSLNPYPYQYPTLSRRVSPGSRQRVKHDHIMSENPYPSTCQLVPDGLARIGRSQVVFVGRL